MTAQLVPTHQRRNVRNGIVGVGVALLIAAGGYAATTTFGPDAYKSEPTPASGDTVTATDQVLRELRESVAGQYGSQSAPPPGGDQAMRDFRETVIKLYGPQPSRDE